MDEKRIQDLKKMLHTKKTWELRQMVEGGSWSEESVEAARRLLQERGGDVKEKKPFAARFFGFIILLTGLIAAAQAVLGFTVSDDDILLLGAAFYQAQKEDGTLPEQLKDRSEDEFQQLIEQNKEQILKEARKKGTQIGAIKAGVALVMFIIAFGAIAGERSISRRFAPVIGIILLILYAVQFKDSLQQFKALRYVDSLALKVPDISWFIAMPLSALACLCLPFFVKKDDISIA